MNVHLVRKKAFWLSLAVLGGFGEGVFGAGPERHALPRVGARVAYVRVPWVACPCPAAVTDRTVH